MRGIDRLSMIIDALADAYDHVLVECGAADVEGVSRLSRGRDTEIIFSIADAHSESFSATLDGYRNVGFDNLLVMASDATVPSGRRAA